MTEKGGNEVGKEMFNKEREKERDPAYGVIRKMKYCKTYCKNERVSFFIIDIFFCLQLRGGYPLVKNQRHFGWPILEYHDTS